MQQILAKEEDPSLPICHFVAGWELFFQKPFKRLPLFFYWPHEPSVHPPVARKMGMTSAGSVKHGGSRGKGDLHEQNWNSVPKEKGGGVSPTTGNVATYLKIILIMENFKHKEK